VYFQHSDEMWEDFPALVPGVLFAQGITSGVPVSAQTAEFAEAASARLSAAPESEQPEIQAWRRAFSKMGLKPTQYRCASESLLRRFKKEGSLPHIHPLVDLCNAISLAYAIPVAVFDTAHVTGYLEVRRAAGNETYLAFSGTGENPEPQEVIFADGAGRAHARRWTNRQSAYSAVQDTTSSVVIVAEALHESALADIERLVGTVAGALKTAWSLAPLSGVLSRTSPRFEFGD
jgi:DNA/RNA-binding domain of Phe-tRNA-synthetase-like protein